MSNSFLLRLTLTIVVSGLGLSGCTIGFQPASKPAPKQPTFQDIQKLSEGEHIRVKYHVPPGMAPSQPVYVSPPTYYSATSVHNAQSRYSPALVYPTVPQIPPQLKIVPNVDYAPPPYPAYNSPPISDYSKYSPPVYSSSVSPTYSPVEKPLPMMAAPVPLVEKNPPLIQSSVVPQPNFHVVGESDDLYSIALLYNRSPAELASWNGLEPPYTLKQGQRLQVSH